MNPLDLSRMWRLYRMAERSRTGCASYILRAAALDGIESEMHGHDCMAWLREVLRPSDVMTFVAAGFHVVSVRDRTTGGFRGASHVDPNRAAAATIAQHLPYCGLIPTCGDDGRPEVCPHDGQPCGGECPAFDPCHPAPKEGE